MASAKQIRDEIMRMTIVVNSNPAQQEIYKLTEANRKFADESTKLRAERVKVGQTLGKNSQEYKDLTTQINSNSSSVTENKRKMKELSDSLDISQMSVKQLKQEAMLLRKELERVVPGSQQYNALQSQLGAVNGRLAEVRGSANATSSSFGSLAARFNHYSGIITAGVAMFVGFGVSIQAVIDRNNKLVDAQTAVAKTVGMTTDEVNELTKAFSKFDTRTSRIDLLKIAETGGRLGIGKEQIKEFVREVDKANVALGDGFAGGVEAVTDTLGKLKNLYGETKDLDMATAINQIGSAMNELGASGAATEENIGDFALRLGSLPSGLKPSIAEALALGAAFEESGVNAERAGTAYATFIRNAATNADRFAKVMGITKKEVQDMMNTDPLEFFLKFSEGMKGMDTTKLAETMDYLKMNDQYVISTMGAASENTDRFRASIELSNKSLTEATSLTDEFNKVNNNTSAIFDKVQKKFLGMFTSQAVADTLNYLISAFGKFIGAIEDAEGNITSFRNGLVFLIKVVTLMIATMISYNLATGVYNTLMVTAYQRVLGLTIVEKARNAVMLLSNGIATLYRATLWLLAAGYSLVTGNVVGATFAMRGFSAALMANPLGAIIGLITLAASAYLLFKKNGESAIATQEKLNKATAIQREVLEQGKIAQDKFRDSTQLLINTLKSEIATKEMRKKAYESLIRIHPEFMNTIDSEYKATAKLAEVYRNLAFQIDLSAKAKARAAAKESIYTQIEKDRIEFVKGETARQKEQDERNKTRAENRKKDNEAATGSKFSPNTAFGYDTKRGDLNFIENNKGAALLNSINANTQLLQKLNKMDSDRVNEIQNLLKKANGPERKKLQAELDLFFNPTNAPGSDSVSNYNSPGSDEKKSPKITKPKSTAAADRRHEKEMLDARKRGNDAETLARQIELDIEDAKIEAMEQGFEKELAALDSQEQRKLAAIDKQKISQLEFDEIDKKIAKATGDDKAYFESLKQSWVDNNTGLEELKDRQAIIFAQKRKTLKVKFQNEEFKDLDDSFKKELSLLERQKNDELATFTSLADLKAGLRGRMNAKDIAQIETWEQGKEALNKVYQRKEVEMQVAHMETMLSLYEGLDLSVLTKEQQDQVLKFIEDAKNKISELKAVQNSTGQTEGEGKRGKLGGGGSKDILGMSTDDWDTFFTNIETGADKLGTIIAAVQAVQAAFALYYQYVQANEQAQMQQVDRNAKKREQRLKAMLDSGQLNQEQYEKEVQKLNDETELKKAKLEYESAKRQRAMAIAQVAINTAVAIMGIWKDFPKFDFGATAAIMSGFVGALGVAQIATIAAQPLPSAPGYEDGFGTDYDMRRAQDGKQFRVTRKRLSSGEVHSPTHFIAGEKGTEMVIDSPTYTRFRPEVKRMLRNEISYARGFENGLYPQNNGGGSNNEEKLMLIIEQNTLAMNALREKKFTAVVGKTMDNAKEILEMTDEYSGYKNSSKK